MVRSNNQNSLRPHICFNNFSPPPCRAQATIAKQQPQLAAASRIQIQEPRCRKLPGEDTELGQQHVWYFAYGANMLPACLEGQHGVKPLRTEKCVVEGYTLTFNYMVRACTCSCPGQSFQLHAARLGRYMMSCMHAYVACPAPLLCLQVPAA